MKRIRLLLTILMVSFGMCSFAQDWTASEVGAGNFYLYNVGKGQFLTSGNGWGTQASVSANSALTVTLEENNGAYKLRTNHGGDGKGVENLSGETIYTDQSISKNSTWTFAKVADGSNGPVYTIVSKDNHGGGAGSYMAASADNTIVGPASAVTDDYGRWQLVQSWITNSLPVSDANGWTVSQTPTFDKGQVCAEFWSKAGATIKQTLSNLPAGSYELIAVALTRTGMTATLNAGSNTMNIATVSSGDVNDRAGANTWFNNGNGVNKLEFTHAGGSLEIGLTADNTTGDHWLVWRSIILLYKGLDLSELKAALQAQIDAVPALEGTTTSAAYNAAKNYADGIDMDALTTEEAISTASTELANLVNAATALQGSYSRYAAIRDAALAIAPSIVLPDVESATTTAAIDDAIPTLRAAFLTELPNVEIPQDPGYIDVTSVMVDNAGVHTNTDYWTIEGTPNGGYSFGVCNYGECEFYQQNFKFYQTLALTPGTWEFGVTGFHRAGNHNTNFYAGVDKILIPGVASDVVNTMAQAKTYFDGGNGKVALKFLIETAGDVEIGIDNQDSETDKWTIFRDFTLKYYGAPDYTVYEDQWDALVSDAATAKTTYANSIGTELTALNAAIADSPEGSNLKATYLAKIEALQTALNTFNAAGPNYDALAREIAKAKALGIASATADNYAATSSTTAATALTNTQDLKVAEYNYVADNYSYAVELGTWNASANAGTLSGQHWDGTNSSTYLEQGAGDLAYNLSEWTVTYDQTLFLPAGNYIFKVAGRTATDHVTITLNVTDVTDPENEVLLGTVNDFPKGDTGLGINTSGATSFDAEDAAGFANNGTGRGWEWRYVKFTLADPAAVEVKVEAVADAQYRWMGFCNPTVQTNDPDNVALMTDLVDLNNAKAAATLTQRTNKGTGVFQYNQTTDDDLWSDYSTAKSNADAFTLAADTEVEDVTALTTALNDAKDAYSANNVLNAPAADKRYYLYIVDAGQSWDGNAVTFIAGGRNDMGNYLIQYLAPANEYMNQALKFTAVDGEVNTYKVSAIRVENGAEQYITTGSTYSGNDTQIRTTDDEAKASWIKIQATTTDGQFQLLNVSDGNKVIGRNATNPDNGMYTDGNNSFTIEEASQAEVTVSCKAGKYGTVIFPFTPDVSTGFDGITFYSAESVNGATQKVQITEVAEPVANVPYLIKNDNGENFSKDVTGWGTATADSYTDEAGLLTGVYTNADINGDNRYVLQTPTSGENEGIQAFYKVDGTFTATPYRCYLTYLAPNQAHMLKLFFEEEETTGINSIDNGQLIMDNGAVYDLQGRKVQNPKRGMYIINGKKVIVK